MHNRLFGMAKSGGLSHNLVLVDGQDMQIRGAKTAGRLLSFDPDKTGELLPLYWIIMVIPE